MPGQAHVNLSTLLAGSCVHRAASRTARLPSRLPACLTACLPVLRLCGSCMQAGIALGLAQAVAARFPLWGPDFAALLAGMVVMNLLTGPPLFKVLMVVHGCDCGDGWCREGCGYGFRSLRLVCLVRS